MLLPIEQNRTIEFLETSIMVHFLRLLQRINLEAETSAV